MVRGQPSRQGFHLSPVRLSLGNRVWAPSARGARRRRDWTSSHRDGSRYRVSILRILWLSFQLLRVERSCETRVSNVGLGFRLGFSDCPRLYGGLVVRRASYEGRQSGGGAVPLATGMLQGWGLLHASARVAGMQHRCEAMQHRCEAMSCEPEALRRDLETLSGGGFRLSALEAFEGFPYTELVESIALLV